MAGKRVTIAGRTCEVRDSQPRIKACTIDFGVRQAPPAEMRDLDVIVAFAPREPVAESGVSFEVTLGVTRSAKDPGEAVLTLEAQGVEVVRGTEYARGVPVRGPVVETTNAQTRASAETVKQHERQGEISGSGKMRLNPLQVFKSLIGAGDGDPVEADLGIGAEGRASAGSNRSETAVDDGSTVLSEERQLHRTVYDGNGRWRFIEPLPGRWLVDNYVATDAKYGLCSVEPTGGEIRLQMICAVKKRHVQIDELTIDGRTRADWNVEQARVLEILAKRGVFEGDDDRLVVAKVTVSEAGDA